jgi:hypothetical protein
MVKLRDHAIFNGLADHVTGYSEVTPQELDALRQAAALITGPSALDHESSE